MKTKNLVALVIGLSIMGNVVNGQEKNHSAGPFNVRNSEKFETPKRHKVLDPIPYEKIGIIQVSGKGTESYNFQVFDNNLKKIKENTVEIGTKLNDDVSLPNLVKLNSKSYLFVREVFRDTKTEGITALEFDPNTLTFVGTGKNLFKSTGKIRIGGGFGFYGFGMTTAVTSIEGYDFETSDDKTKFLFTYSLIPKEKRDKLNSDIIGMYVFDENLKKVWGDEIEMPYTEAKMDNLGYTVGNDGKVYLIAKVYEGDDPKEKRDKKIPNFHYEVLIYDKGKAKPMIVPVRLDKFYPKSVAVYENATRGMIVSGFYSKGMNKPVDGYYMVKLDVDKGSVSKINEGYYEIPSEIIKSYTSEREKRKLEKKEENDEDKDLGVENLKLRNVYYMPDGTTKVVAEQYVMIVTSYFDFSCKCQRTRYDTYADDIFLISIDSKGKQEWVKKIPKNQHASDARGAGLSINTYVTGNDVNIFFIDNIKNENLAVTEAPKRHENGRGGFLTAIRVTPNGDIKRYNLGEIDDYETNFYIRYFVDGENNNLISTERRKKEDMLFSIDIKK